jgi:hypothetical protein
MNFTPLRPPDTFHVQAAQGWLELGKPDEANEELEKITPELRAHPDVLEIRWQIYAKEKKWAVCADIARTITEIAPSRLNGWVHLAYSLRRVEGFGSSLRRVESFGLQAAFQTLEPMTQKFPLEWIIPYNLACYTAQMRRLDEAHGWLKKAFALAAKMNRLNEIRLTALDDPDLEPLWNG